MIWDERLNLAASLYEPGEVGADIGTDHAYLPWLLLERGICRRMLLCDISPKSIGQAQKTVCRHHLEQQTEIILADGLSGVREHCSCISVMGMGGETMAAILREGRERLQDAVLVLSAHTEQELVRCAVRDIGYRITAERLCVAGGRYYVVWRAEPGAWQPTEQELRYGSLLYGEPKKLLLPYLSWRRKVLQAQIDGMRKADEKDPQMIREAEEALHYYELQSAVCEERYDSTGNL